eukprot:CAMPEP_0182854032 /NCGR_PEP_ID=MMETSP0034_2-20130328/1018_1 /TAXON_ID=156128 /ORGANISM="Nephroselmis pyriformis, Strain CCMP717" /LENGTH=207 /DNA_ID=CAMNT_0024984825 /DNA_START=65 /DNA_END=688 /DNA_ORIENTATION=-
MADEKEVAVVEDKPLGDPEPDFSKKHPLEHAWTLWFDNPNGRSKQSTWGQTLRTVYTFSTVEDFWCLYNNIVPPSRLPHGADFHLFKEGIEPKWEDAKCAQGGKWNVPVPKSNNKVMLDQMWLHTLLGMIGEQYEEGDEICGAVCSVRTKQDRIGLWTKTASNEAVQVTVGKDLKTLLDLSDSTRIGFLAHSDAMKMDRKAKDRYPL